MQPKILLIILVAVLFLSGCVQQQEQQTEPVGENGNAYTEQLQDANENPTITADEAIAILSETIENSPDFDDLTAEMDENSLINELPE